MNARIYRHNAFTTLVRRIVFSDSGTPTLAATRLSLRSLPLVCRVQCRQLLASSMAASAPPAAEAGRSLRVLSWNTSNAQQSASRPQGSGRAEQEKGFADTILGLLPDVICLQELQPGGSLSKLLYEHYQGPYGQAESHMGFCSTWVLRSNKDLLVMEEYGAWTVGPATLLPIQSSIIGRLVVANCHLEPFKTGGAIRLETLEQIQSECDRMLTKKQGTKKVRIDGAMIIAGDMNMRAAEDSAVTAGLKLKDCWEAAGKKMATNWNTKKNLYYHDGFQYNARYDRVYFQGGNLSCSGFVLVGDEPASSNPGHFLSDHFGIMATFSW